MKAEYKRDLQNNYLILEAAEPDTEEGYDLRMAEQNQVRGLLPVYESRLDGKRYLHYEITSKQTLESLYEKKVMGYQDILYILSGIRDTLEEMRKYLLSPKQLLFAPELIYVTPERGGLLLCYYVKEGEYPITVLAEFILKKLDHRDRQAVSLGYAFFQQASGANFSLVKTLREILAVSGEAGRQAAVRAHGQTDGRGVSGGSAIFGDTDGNGIRLAARPGKEGDEPFCGAGREKEERDVLQGAGYGEEEHELLRGTGCRQAGNENIRNRTYRQNGKPDSRDRSTERQDGFANREEWPCEGDSPVIHRERGKKREAKKKLADRIFMKVHPAILLTFLLLMVGLEALLACRVLGLTEAGGCFFLILSAEILINRRITDRRQTGQSNWEEEEDDEEYQRILQEMYQNEAAVEADPIEETCFLVPEAEKNELYLTCLSGDGFEPGVYPDIFPGGNPVYIGKIPGEADVILNSSTVSRMHARFERRGNSYYLKDMNSKNGTFVNDRRLMPQEECEIQENDRVNFAEIGYHVVKRRGR